MFKVNNRNTRITREICSKFKDTRMTPMANASIVNFEQVNVGWDDTTV